MNYSIKYFTLKYIKNIRTICVNIFIIETSAWICLYTSDDENKNTIKAMREWSEIYRKCNAGNVMQEYENDYDYKAVGICGPNKSPSKLPRGMCLNMFAFVRWNLYNTECLWYTYNSGLYYFFISRSKRRVVPYKQIMVVGVILLSKHTHIYIHIVVKFVAVISSARPLHI